jgi:tetratricopeptide (TPR) repeat protein
VGWLWYLGVLVPMIGLVQLGYQARADRYTYLPLIGIFVAAAWTLDDLVRRRPRLRPLVAAACAAALVACAGLSWRQIGFWRSSVTLFERAVAVTPPNAYAQGLLGVALGETGDHEAAATHFRAALEIWPWERNLRRHFLDNARRRGRLAEAEAELAELDARTGARP